MSAFLGSLLSHDVDDSMISDETKKAVYSRPNSPIFAPFMIHIVCNLLNEYRSQHGGGALIDIESEIASWGGGLRQLRQCFPEWDHRVNECCKTTPIDHIVWKQFIDHHNVSISSMRHSNSSTFILEQLLQIWRNCGEENRTYGPYPSPFEQQQYQNASVVPMGYLSEAILQLKFEAAFKANNCDIATYVLQNQRQKMDEDRDAKEAKYDALDRENPLNDTMPWDYDEIVVQRSPLRNDANHKNRNGILYYQSAHFTAKQCADIANHFKMNRDAAPLLLFGDNNVDKNRDKSRANRQFSGGQAESVGVYDDWFAFGITTSWKHKGGSAYFQGVAQPTDYNTFKRIMDQQFAVLIKQIENGRDVIVPAPNENDLRQRTNKYYQHNVQQVRHNLGTGIANLDMNYLKYIQLKLDELQRCAKDTKHINYCRTYGAQQAQRQRNAAWNINNLPFDTMDVDKTNDVRQRLGFEHEEKLSNPQNDPYGSLIYQSPQQKPQRRSGYVQNRDINVQHNEYSGAQMSETSPDMQSNASTPYNSGNKRRLFHYKSPSGYVEDEEQYWELCSPSIKSERARFSSSASPTLPMKYRQNNRNEPNVFFHAISCCLLIFFYYPRKMYMALIVQNRPQDVIRIMSCLCMMFAAISYVIAANVTSATLIWIVLAIFFAWAGGDQFYQQRHRQRHTFYQ